MAANLDFQKMTQDQMQAANTAAMSVAKGLQSIAAEASDYSKKVVENGAALVEKLLGAKTVESAMQLQTDYARSAYEGLMAETKKLGDLYGAVAKDAMRPLEVAMGKVSAAA